jgi:hypothetical protein
MITLKIKPLLYTSLILLMPLLAKADNITLITGTPGDDLLATPTGPSPNLDGTLITFAGLPDFTPTYTTTDPLVTDGATFSSPDGLTVEPFSTQSNPNFLVDDSTDGSAFITIGLSTGTGAIGVGIADSDDTCTVSPGSCPGNTVAPVTILLQALGASGDLGPAFEVTIPENTVNPGNGYFVVNDSTGAGILGLEIIAPQTDESGLAIADVQVSPTPEPSSIAFLLGGIMAIVGFSRLRKKA